MLDLNATPEQLRKAYQDSQAENLRLQTIIKLQKEEIRLLHIQKWGPKADKLSEGQLAFLPPKSSLPPRRWSAKPPCPRRISSCRPFPRPKRRAPITPAGPNCPR